MWVKGALRSCWKAKSPACLHVGKGGIAFLLEGEVPCMPVCGERGHCLLLGRRSLLHACMWGKGALRSFWKAKPLHAGSWGNSTVKSAYLKANPLHACMWGKSTLLASRKADSLRNSMWGKSTLRVCWKAKSPACLHVGKEYNACLLIERRIHCMPACGERVHCVRAWRKANPLHACIRGKSILRAAYRKAY